MTIREFTSAYCGRSLPLAMTSYLGTFAVYFGSLALAVQVPGSLLLLVPLVILNGLSGVRLYVLQHDCGHLSLFAGRRANEVAGLVLSPFTLAPFRAMQHNHNVHHAHVGDLDTRRSGEVHTMTLAEWRSAGPGTRLWYRLYRHPALMIPLGGLYTYLVRYRWPKSARQAGVGGVIVHNMLVLGWVACIWLWAGWTGLAIHAACLVVAVCVGVFLVYLQHNFEDTYWDRKPAHRLKTAVIEGSSALDLGWWFDLATANIAYHDLHHDNPRIPSYRLRRCHRDARAVFDLPVIGWPQALRSFRLKLWDEETRQLVPFPPAQPPFARRNATRAAVDPSLPAASSVPSTTG